ncbi:MAG TPA: FlgD immunoglobulin-like domain containing protein [bacterium]|nr:FlgD immunoglobulin-like domain containing protein [bacterium]
MKFSPETLLRIYLDGSFTEEAQAEFDALMRRDPAFAEQVTQAVAERLGPVPEASVEAIASRLDAQVMDLWARHKPSPWLKNLQLGGKALVALGVVALGYWGFRHWTSMTTIQAGTAAAPVPGTFLSGQAEGAKKNPAKELPDHSTVRQVRSVARPPEPDNAAREEGGTAGIQDRRTLSAKAPANTQERSPMPVVPAVSTQSKSASALGDALRVDIHSDRPGPATITIFDAHGNLVRHLFAGPVEAGDRYVDWDGKDDLGVPVLPGSYHVVLGLNGKKMSGVLKILPK